MPPGRALRRRWSAGGLLLTRERVDFRVYNAAMDSRTVLRRLRADGWYVDRIIGSHHQMKHPDKPGTTTVLHPQKDLKIGTIISIEKQSGVRLRR